ncbi:hypothetical protein Cme02nite_50300 [Catellatospora methionotrophica]|uniref:MFS transporter n=1 Tax=Catellatospora methionotrophica TaxID=121620 RepID=A0A8J3PHR9_9ACTN|nr:MFS transporter [Catellatospora methionotrophica]GIG16698.1 hypothetical protein Cme02nite_50300 [Catellatospora methionotrophica]
MSSTQAQQHSVRVYLTGFFLTNVGVGGFTLATGLALFAQTGSVGTFGLLVGVEYLLGFVGQLVGGSILDRRDVLTVALISNCLRGVAVVAGGLLYWWTEAPAALIGVFLLSAFIRPLYRAASFVMVRQVADTDKLTQVNAVRFGLLQVAQLGGLGVVSVMFALLPGGGVICAIGLFFLAGTAVHLRLRSMPNRRPAAVTNGTPAVGPAITLRQNWRELGQLLVSNPGLRVHLVLAVMPSVITSLATVLVAPVNQAMAGGSAGIAVLDGGAAIGALVTVLLVRRISAARPYLIGVACATAALALGLLAVAPSLALAGAAFCLIGAASTLGATSGDTLLQLRSASEVLGRLSIARECMTSLTAIALIPLTGPLTARWGVDSTALVFAAIAAGYLALFLTTAAVLRERFFGQRAVLPPAAASTYRMAAST